MSSLRVEATDATGTGNGVETSGGRRKPRRRTLAQHGHRDLLAHLDSERVREGTVERRACHHRHVCGTPSELVQIDLDQALPERGSKRLPDLRGHLGARALDRQPLHRERRRPTGCRIEADSDEEDQDPGEKGAAGGSEASQLGATGRGAAWKRHNGASRARARTRATP